MRGDHGRKRARTSDRDRAVEAITLAYVDGQIDEHDRDERVARALTSASLDGLRPILSDLQVPEHLRPPEPTSSVPATRAAPSPDVRPIGRSRSWAETRERLRHAPRRRKALYATAAVAVPVTLVAAVLAGGGDETQELDLHSAAGIEQLVADVEEQFGTTEVLEAEINDTWARVYVQEDGNRFRYYTYGRPLEPSQEVSDFFGDGSGGTTQDADPDLVDLRELDADALVANIERARAELGVEGEDVEVAVTIADERMATGFGQSEAFASAGEDAPPHVEIELRNEYMESGQLTTDLSGERVLMRSPVP